MNEDSVVSSLNELRRMANERSRREGEARARLEAERRAWEDRNRAGRHGETRSRPADGRPEGKAAPHTMTYGFPEATIQVEGNGPIGQWQPTPAQTQTLAIEQQMNESQTARMSAAEWAAREAPAAPALSVRQKSPFGWVLLTAVIMGLGGAAGYVQVKKQHDALLSTERDINRKLEETKNQAVEAAARADAQLKAQTNSFDQRIKMLTARAAGAAPMVATDVHTSPVAPKVEAPRGAAGAMVAKAPRGRSRRAWRSHNGAWSKRGAAAAAAEMNAADVKKPVLPNIARKKKLNDDPLDGLKL